MDVSRPLEGLLPGVDTGVLSVLASSTQPRTGREIAKRAGRSHVAVQKVLDRFVEHGLAERQTVGRSYIYTMNRDHVSAPGVAALTSLRNELIQRLKTEIRGWAVQAEHASLFDPAARADGTARSDIDLFLIRPASVPEDDPAWRGQLEDLSANILRWTGNHAAIAEVGWDDLETLEPDDPPVLKSLRKDGIDLAGRPIRDVLPPAE